MCAHVCLCVCISIRAHGDVCELSPGPISWCTNAEGRARPTNHRARHGHQTHHRSSVREGDGGLRKTQHHLKTQSVTNAPVIRVRTCPLDPERSIQTWSICTALPLRVPRTFASHFLSIKISTSAHSDPRIDRILGHRRCEPQRQNGHSTCQVL